MHVVVPASRVASFADLVSIGAALVERYDGTGTVLSVVEVPEDRSLSEGALTAQRRRSLLRQISRIGPEQAFRADVRTARSVETGIRAAIEDAQSGILLLGWKPGGRSSVDRTLVRLVEDPPCDLALVKKGKAPDVRSVLVPIRGGPHARLALKVAEALAERYGAALTLLHVDVPLWSRTRRVLEDQFFDAVRDRVTYPITQEVRVDASSVEEAIMRIGEENDLIVMGASARDESSSYLLGRLPERVARKVDGTVIVVKTREAVTGRTFGLRSQSLEAPETQDISEIVDRWFAENTFHSHEFRALRDLVDLKERQGKTISLALPTLNEEKTVGKILSTIKRQLVDRFPLIDELLVIDSNSEDRTALIAESMGVPVFRHPDILPDRGSYTGKGEALWKSLFITRGDIVVWIDSDITGIHPKFVYGLVGPLLTQPHLGFVKGFYRRPLNLGGQVSTTGGGRVTELTARPLINLFYPQLSGVVQPLAGEMAGRREVLEEVPFFTGYGVETGLLIDILRRFGLRSIAQTDLQERIHRNQTLLSLSKMAFAVVQVVLKRLGEERRLELLEEVSTSMKLIHYSPTELFLEVKEIHECERPPINTLQEYMARSGSTAGAGRVSAVPVASR
jgi:glucosyl-3-phosphoglycerate synthase